jgi:hypothetical protein
MHKDALAMAEQMSVTVENQFIIEALSNAVVATPPTGSWS